MAVVRKRTIPIEGPLFVGEVSANLHFQIIWMQMLDVNNRAYENNGDGKMFVLQNR
jgi:hypothetical protein